MSTEPTYPKAVLLDELEHAVWYGKPEAYFKDSRALIAGEGKESRKDQYDQFIGNYFRTLEDARRGNEGNRHVAYPKRYNPYEFIRTIAYTCQHQELDLYTIDVPHVSLAIKLAGEILLHDELQRNVGVPAEDGRTKLEARKGTSADMAWVAKDLAVLLHYAVSQPDLSQEAMQQTEKIARNLASPANTRDLSLARLAGTIQETRLPDVPDNKLILLQALQRGVATDATARDGSFDDVLVSPFGSGMVLRSQPGDGKLVETFADRSQGLSSAFYIHLLKQAAAIEDESAEGHFRPQRFIGAGQKLLQMSYDLGNGFLRTAAKIFGNWAHLPFFRSEEVVARKIMGVGRKKIKKISALRPVDPRIAPPAQPAAQR